MPKLIDYPRTTYAGAWELSEIVDDTGGKCAIDTAARKLNRKVSGSFKAIIGSAVKFGLLTSKRDLLTTTTLFKRIKHAYDKQEELLFHREAFLTPPLFTQLCRKFRSRELPVQMLDVMLIREFSVEEINAPGVAKAFVEGCRMVGLLDEHNHITDIDALSAQIRPRRELASPIPTINNFRDEQTISNSLQSTTATTAPAQRPTKSSETKEDKYKLDDNRRDTDARSTRTLLSHVATGPMTGLDNQDAIANLFGLSSLPTNPLTNSIGTPSSEESEGIQPKDNLNSDAPSTIPSTPLVQPLANQVALSPATTAIITGYQIQISGPGMNTSLSITEEMDITLAIALLEKIRRQLIA